MEQAFPVTEEYAILKAIYYRLSETMNKKGQIG